MNDNNVEHRIGKLRHINSLTAEEVRVELEKRLLLDVKSIEKLSDEQCRALLKEKDSYYGKPRYFKGNIVIEGKIDEEVQKRTAGIEKLLQLSIEQNERINLAKTNADRDLAQARVDLGELDKLYVKQTAELQTIYRQLSELQKEKAHLDLRVEATKEYDSTKSQLDLMLSKVQEYDASISQLEEKAKIAEEQAGSVEEKLNAAKEVIKDLESYRADAEEMIRKQESALEELRGKIDSAEKKLSTVSSEREELSARLQEYVGRNVDLESSLISHKDQIKLIQGKYDRLQAYVQELEAKETEHSSSITTLGNKLSAEHSEADKKIKMLEDAIASLGVQLGSERFRRRGWMGTAVASAAAVAFLFFGLPRNAESAVENVPTDISPSKDYVEFAERLPDGKYQVTFDSESYTMSFRKLNEVYGKFRELEADGRELSFSERRDILEVLADKDNYIKD